MTLTMLMKMATQKICHSVKALTQVMNFHSCDWILIMCRLAKLHNIVSTSHGVIRMCRGQQCIDPMGRTKISVDRTNVVVLIVMCGVTMTRRQASTSSHGVNRVLTSAIVVARLIVKLKPRMVTHAFTSRAAVINTRSLRACVPRSCRMASRDVNIGPSLVDVMKMMKWCSMAKGVQIINTISSESTLNCIQSSKKRTNDRYRKLSQSMCQIIGSSNSSNGCFCYWP